MHISSLDKVEKTIPDMEGAKDVFKQIPISREHGTPSFSFRVFTIQPGGHTPLHTHQFEHLNYVIEGNGMVMTEDGSYAANLERAAVAPLAEKPASKLDDLKEVHTPGLSTIEQVIPQVPARGHDQDHHLPGG